LASEAEERAYWEQSDSVADLDWRRGERVRLPNLHPSTISISLRLPISLLEQIKIAAHKRDVPYQPRRWGRAGPKVRRRQAAACRRDEFRYYGHG
jgi:predicted DNA binding CopG/RHH family protein